jgi:hypothetical protein
VGLKFFKSTHRIDDAYLADLMREATPTGEIAADIEKMCKIVGLAVAPIQMSAHLLHDYGSPTDEEVVGYLFGWLDAFKTNVWHVHDFNRSFFHYGFLIWFGSSESGDRGANHMQKAMSAMTCLGLSITDAAPRFMAAAKRGQAEARAFLVEQKPPKGPTFR